jgi:glucokinase
MSVDFAFPVLIGDIGGTNARFAIVPDKAQAPVRFEPVQLSHFSQIGDAIRHATAGHALLKPRTTVLAIATPLVGERFRLTNAEWIIDPMAMIQEFGLEEVALMNDFAAQGLAALALQKEHLSQIGEGRIVEGHPKAVVGAGTGLGIAQIVRIEGRWAIISGEGGHVDLGPRSQREFAIWPHLAKIEGRMSAEEALSGRGIENLYSALCAADGVTPVIADAAGISAAALSRSDPRAGEAIDLFFTLLGRVAGDMALLTLARGGVYLAGGIAQKLLPAIDPSRFRAAFTDKAPHRAILSEIPVMVMTHPTAALEGLSAWVSKPDEFSLEGATRRFGSGA